MSNVATISSKDVRELIPGQNDIYSKSLARILKEEFNDAIKSAKVYVLDKSPFVELFENMAFDPPLECCEFILNEQYQLLKRVSNSEDDMNLICFDDYDLIFELTYIPDFSADQFSAREKTFCEALNRFFIIRTLQSRQLGSSQYSRKRG